MPGSSCWGPASARARASTSRSTASPAPPAGTSLSGAVRTPDGDREWATWEDLDVDDEDFDRIGEAFLATGAVSSGPVGDATGHLFDLAAGVAFATRWMSENREGAAP